ncbi:MAG: hypothetical protein AB7O95_13900 [Geminicoccaceae bacterium]
MNRPRPQLVAGVVVPAGKPCELMAAALQGWRKHARRSGVPPLPELDELERLFRQAGALPVLAPVPEMDSVDRLPASFSVSVGEAARSLAIVERAVTAAANRNRLQGRKDHRGRWWFEPEAIEAYREVQARRR